MYKSNIHSRSCYRVQHCNASDGLIAKYQTEYQVDQFACCRWTLFRKMPKQKNAQTGMQSVYLGRKCLAEWPIIGVGQTRQCRTVVISACASEPTPEPRDLQQFASVRSDRRQIRLRLSKQYSTPVSSASTRLRPTGRARLLSLRESAFYLRIRCVMADAQVVSAHEFLRQQGSSCIVLHPTLRLLFLGYGCDEIPRAVPHCIAHHEGNLANGGTVTPATAGSWGPDVTAYHALTEV